MADRNRRTTMAAIALPVLLIAMAGLARANTIVVNTLDSGSQPFPLCTLEDAVAAANTQTIQGGCPQGTGNDDTIEFIVTGTILPDNTLTIDNTSETLFIEGPPFGGITIDGQNTIELVDAEGTDLEAQNLTFTHGSSDFGGAIFAGDSLIGIEDCTFVNNGALGGGAFAGDYSLAFFLNDTFTGNSAELGGGIFDEDSLVGVSNCTFAANLAGGGADIASETLGETEANSTIFASTGGNNCDGVTDDGYNISNDNSCGFTPPSVNNSATLDLDPMGLQNNGGPTQTIALESGSQAIDFVPLASCLGPFGAPVTDDQRLFNRPDSDGGVPESFCDAGAYESGAVAPIVLAPNSERLQIARSGAANSDNVNTAFTFIYNGDPDCDISTGGDEDALNSGVGVALFEGSCANLPPSGLVLYLDPFQVHTVNHEQYGTLFQSFGPETVSARMVALPTPAGACGAWTLNLEVAGLDTPALGLGGNGPFALVVTDVYGDVEEVGVATQALTLADIYGDAAGCFDITNAIVGNQIPTPSHSVRRGVRRQTRR
ncbi:choice-of-anchor Q domain-containing protein [Candidatus Binatus sp.]|uniref:choice-of-anchor Q domain-containing protein n=1 Tax=Candidatus Binatus sp. TaxID=2811406 RepID=UPI003CC57B99